MGDEGLEPSHSLTGDSAVRNQSDAKSDAVISGNHLLAIDDGGNFDDHDAGLAAIVEAWPKLAADARRAVLEFVERQLAALTAANDGRPAGS